MKKTFSTWGRIIIPLIIILVSNTVKAQTTIREVTSYMKSSGDWIASDTKYANLVEDQQTTWWYRTFVHGYEYKIVAFSEDADVSDMELEVQYSDGTSFSYDVSEWATVYIRPLTKAGVRMRIRMKNYLSDDPDYASKCNFIVFLREY